MQDLVIIGFTVAANEISAGSHLATSETVGLALWQPDTSCIVAIIPTLVKNKKLSYFDFRFNDLGDCLRA